MVSNKKILITEDEGIVALEIRETLENLGYQIAGVAQTGLEALDLAKEQKPDLVLMDIMLQGSMDGIEAAEKIYTIFDIPIIFLTSHSDDSTMKSVLKTYAFGYLIKPFNDRELYSAIEMTLHKHSVIKKVGQDTLIDSTLRLVSDAVVTTDADGEVTRINPSAQALTGYSSELAADYDIFHFFNKKDRSRISEMMELVKNDSSDRKTLLSWVDSLTLINSSGDAMPASLNIGFVKGDKWNGDEFFFILIPNTNRGGLYGGEETSLERYYRIVLDAIKDAVFLMDTSYHIIVYNQAFANLCTLLEIDLKLDKMVFEILPNDIFGKSWDYKEFFDQRRSQSGDIPIKERTYIKNKKAYYLNIEAIPLSDGNRITHVAIICFDVTWEKEVDERDEKLSKNFRAHSNNVEQIADICARLKPPVSAIKKIAGPQNTFEFRKVMKSANELSDLIFEMDMKWLKYERIKSIFSALGMDIPDDKMIVEEEPSDIKGASPKTLDEIDNEDVSADSENSETVNDTESGAVSSNNADTEGKTDTTATSPSTQNTQTEGSPSTTDSENALAIEQNAEVLAKRTQGMSDSEDAREDEFLKTLRSDVKTK